VGRRDDQEDPMAEQVVTTPHGALPTYLSVPQGSGPWPAVVALHDAAGMTADLRRQADWLAGEGFLTAAPDLFARGRGMRCLLQVAREVRAGSGRAYDEVDAVRTWLGARDDCTGRVGVIGWCMGGGFALMLAPRGGYDASSVNYGAASGDAYGPDALRGACPIVGSFGAKDFSLRGSAAKLEASLTAAGVPHDVKEYPDANHSFLNDHDRADLPVLFRISARLGMRYHDASAVDARRRIVAFFDAHLR
jgi:carboxymethylenebutenolidase